MMVLFLLAGLLTSIICYFLWPRMRKDFEKDRELKAEAKNAPFFHRIFQLILVCLIAPFLETLVFQYGIFKLIKFIFIWESLYLPAYLIVCSLVFAWVHGLVNQDWKSGLIHLPLSIGLSLVFLIGTSRGLHPFRDSFLFHGLWNFLAVTLVPLGGSFWDSLANKRKEISSPGSPQ